MRTEKKKSPWKKGLVSWIDDGDLHISIAFTWLIEKARAMAEDHDGRCIVGGPATNLVDIDWATVHEESDRDVLGIHNPMATFTTRGCPNKCSFCAVPKIEGDLVELKEWKAVPYICDNNILAASKAHFKRVIDSLISIKGVDFNQGLEAGKLSQWHLDQILRLRVPMIRFSFDTVLHEAAVMDALSMCLESGVPPSRLGVYVLFGFNDMLDDALYRMEKIRSLGIFPNPMRYQPLDTAKKNSFVNDLWKERDLLDVMRFYSRLRIWRKATFKEYVESGGFGNRKTETVLSRGDVWYSTYLIRLHRPS